MKTLGLIAGFFLFTLFFVLTLISQQLYLNRKNVAIAAPTPIVQTAPVALVEDALPINVENIKPVHVDFTQTTEEPRVAILKAFFARYNSPLEGYAQAIIDSADNYGLDWRLLPAIAMQESTLCKRIPKDSFNCWGFGIYGGKVTRFSDYGEAVNVITRAMARDYHGLEDPAEVVTKYTPGNTNNWSGNVSYIMGRISETEELKRDSVATSEAN